MFLERAGRADRVDGCGERGVCGPGEAFEEGDGGWDEAGGGGERAGEGGG